MIRLNFTLVISLLLVTTLLGNNKPGGRYDADLTVMCNTTVTAVANPVSACQVGEQVTLTALISGDYQSVSWTPALGLSDPNAVSTSATITGSTTYEVTVHGFSSQNLIANGSFDQSFTGFSSDYSVGAGGTFGLLSLEATYAIASNASLTHTNFANCTDHTGGGNMMVVNGSNVPNQDVLCQTISVAPNTNYGFSAWITSVVNTSPAQLQLSVNGTLIGGIYSASPTTCQWTQFFEAFNSGAASSVEICLVNQNTQTSGNDFAIDDLFFGEICETTDQVTVNLVNVNADWLAPQDLCTFSNPVLLNSYLLPTATTGGSWTINGSPATVISPAVLGAGIFTLTYTVTAGACEASVSQMITIAPQPVAAWLPPLDLCDVSAPFLLSDLLLPGATPGGSWTVNGQGVSFFNPAQLGPGSHFVQYTVGAFPCEDSQGQIVEIGLTPSAAWAPPAMVCAGDAAFPLSNLLLNTGTPGGIWLVNGTVVTDFVPAFWGPGDHQVEYLVGAAPCGESLAGIVEVSPALPPPQPACFDATANTVVFQWPVIPGAGAYEVTVLTNHTGSLSGNTFTVTGLGAGEEVQIQVIASGNGFCDSAPSPVVSCTSVSCVAPVVAIEAVETLCEAENNSIGLSVVVNNNAGTGMWSGPGIVNSVAGTFDPAAAGPGTHRIFYAYTVNSCTTLDSIDIEVQAPPVVSFVSDSPVCETTESVFTFSGAAAPGAVFEWDFGSGTVLSGNSQGPFTVSWPGPGTSDVSLNIDDGICPPVVFSQAIIVDVDQDLPEVFCNTTSNSIEFFWPDAENIAGFNINVLTGQTGFLTSDSTFLLTGLTAGETVDIELIGLSGNACPADTIVVGCEALDCPVILLEIAGPSVICFGTDSNTFNLTANVTGADGSGAGSWSGAGITNAAAGSFSAGTSGIGTHTITYTYEQGGCSYEAIHEIRVVQKPEASFLVDESPVCVSNTTTLSYTGIPLSDGAFHWGLDGGMIISGAGAGPIELGWTEPGTKLVSLVVAQMGCLSDTFWQNVIVDPTIGSPIVMCQTTDDTLHYSWSPIPNADAYLLSVIDGPNGFFTSDTSYAIANLSPGQTISVAVQTVSANTCPGNEIVVACTVAECPEVEASLESIPPVCLPDGQPDTISLHFTILDPGLDSANITWRGAGIFDPAIGQIIVDQSMSANPGWVYLDYTNGPCQWTDSIFVEVLPLPTAGISVAGEICQSDTATVIFDGVASPGSTYFWDFDGGLVVDGSEAGPYRVFWESAGEKQIALTLQDSVCGAAEASAMIEVTPTLAPAIACEATLSSITFSWPVGPAITGVVVNVLEGPAGVLLGNDSYLVSGLQPGQAVTIEVIFSGTGPCGDSAAQLQCSALPCPDVQLDLQQPEPVCFFTGTGNVLLDIVISGDTSGTTWTWSGVGITAPGLGSVTIDEGMIDQENWVYFTIGNGLCSYTDSTLILVGETPIANFTVDPEICLGDSATISFNGQAPPGSLYHWDFAGGSADPGTGAGPHRIAWPAPGVYAVSLFLEFGNCFSDTIFQTVTVAAPLPAPTIFCIAGLETIRVSWPNPPGDAGYELILPDSISAQFTSDTSLIITGLAPGTSVTMTLNYLDNLACRNSTVTGTCTTLTCPEVAVTVSGESLLCAGENTDILIELSASEEVSLDIVYSFQGQETTLSGVAGNETITMTPATSGIFSILSILNTNSPVCAIPLPDDYPITVSQPMNSGTTTNELDLCSGLDTLIVLADLLADYSTGGAWSEISSNPSTAGSFNAQQASFSPRFQVAGAYRFRYTVSPEAPCPSSSTEISINILPSPRAEAGEDLTLDCQYNVASIGSSLTSPGMEYLWTSNNGAPISEPDAAITEVTQAGTYTLTVANPLNGCTAVDAVTISSTISFLIPYAGVQPISCFGANDGQIRVDSVVGGVAPVTISINGGPFTSQDFYGSLPPGAYELRFRDALNCEAVLLFDLPQPDEVVLHINTGIENEENVLQLGDVVTLTAETNLSPNLIDTLQWKPDTLIRLDETRVAVSPSYTSTYFARIIDQNGCTAFDQVTLFVARARDVYIPNAFSPNNDGENDLFMIFAGQEVKSVKTFDIFNRWGELLFTQVAFQPNDIRYGWDGAFRGRVLNSGVFVYSAEIEMIDGEVVIYKGDVVLLR